MWIFLFLPLLWLFGFFGYGNNQQVETRIPICYDISFTKNDGRTLLKENELGEIWGVSSGTTTIEITPIYDEINRDKCDRRNL